MRLKKYVLSWKTNVNNIIYIDNFNSGRAHILNSKMSETLKYIVLLTLLSHLNCLGFNLIYYLYVKKEVCYNKKKQSIAL